MNREFLKEAIADAKAVKESAIANAKAALDESFTPHLKSMLAAKINEMEMEEEEEMYEAKSRMKDKDMNEDYGSMEMEDEMEDEMDLDEILAELEEMDEEVQLNEVEEEEEYEDSDADGIPDEEDDMPEGEAEEEEEIDLEDMMKLDKVNDYIDANDIDLEILEQAEIQVKYSGYIEKERNNANKLLRLEDLKIPDDFDYNNIKSMSIYKYKSQA